MPHSWLKSKITVWFFIPCICSTTQNAFPRQVTSMTFSKENLYLLMSSRTVGNAELPSRVGEDGIEDSLAR